MNRIVFLKGMALATASLAGILLTCALTLESQTTDPWQSTFAVEKGSLGITGSNPYFNLTPGYQLSYKDGKDTETVTVLDQTKLIDGVTTRVVEDREFKDGKLAELTLDYYAIDKATGDVYYFGEDVNVYDKDGKVTGHEGAWLSGVNGARFGLMLPAKPKPGQRFYQEVAPGIAMDRVEIRSDKESITVPDGKFSNVVHVVETTPLESGTNSKWYVAGVGAVKDGDMELVRHGMTTPAPRG